MQLYTILLFIAVIAIMAHGETNTTTNASVTITSVSKMFESPGPDGWAFQFESTRKVDLPLDPDSLTPPWRDREFDEVHLVRVHDWDEKWKPAGSAGLIRNEPLLRGDVITLISGQLIQVGDVYQDGGASYAVLTDGRAKRYVGWPQIKSARRPR